MHLREAWERAAGCEDFTQGTTTLGVKFSSSGCARLPLSQKRNLDGFAFGGCVSLQKGRRSLLIFLQELLVLNLSYSFACSLSPLICLIAADACSVH